MEEVSEGSESEDKNLLQEETSFLQAEEADPIVRRRNLPSSRFTLAAASKMLRKKIPQSGLLMVPKRLWMQTIPTQDCEVVVLFSPRCEETTVNWLVNRLKSSIPELALVVKSHIAASSFALYVSATMNGLVKGGEVLGITKKTKEEYGGGLREISREELHMFQGVEEPATFFTTQEKQLIVLQLLNSMRGAEGDKIADITFRNGQAIIPKLQTDGVIQQILPLHDQKQLEKLRATWVQSFFRYQPLDLIQEYFGPKIGIYFSWLGFYTASLTVPAVIGFVFWINFWGRDQAQEDKAFVVIAFLNVVWGSMWLEAWKRRSAELTHRWGLQDDSHELLQDPRPEFAGDLKVSPVTERVEPWYPSWKRNVVRYFVTIPIILSCLGLVFVAMFVILQFQDWIDSVIERRGLPALLSYFPKFVMAVMISVFDEGYSKIAFRLNDMENYRHEETYQNHLIIKLAVFRLVNSFLVLFYIAFYLQDMESLKAQLAALFVTRQIVGNIKESCIPYILEQIKLAKLSFDMYGSLTPTTEEGKWKEEKRNETTEKKEDKETEKQSGQVDEEKKSSSNEERKESKIEDEESSKPKVPLSRIMSRNRIVSQAEIECNMAKYEDTFEDYLEMFIQFGYVMLFSSAFPLAATCAFVNNLFEIRSDAFKLCCVFQRPFAQRIHSIGVWQDAMEMMCLLGIMVNCMLIGLSGQVHRMFPEMSTTQTILLIIVLEHAMIALKYGISYVIPDEPEWIIQEIAKAEFQRREALKKLSSTSPPTREGSEQSSPKSCPISNLSSMEYIEKSMQTDDSRRSSVEDKNPTELDAVKRINNSEILQEIVQLKSSVNLGRSVSAGDKFKHNVPIISKRWNQNTIDISPQSSSSSGSLGPKQTESLPMLSAPANFDNKKRLFNFVSPEKETVQRKGEFTPSPDKESSGSSRSRSTDSVGGASTIKEDVVLTPMEPALIKESKQTEADNRRISLPSQGEKRKKKYPSIESLPLSSHSEMPTRRVETFIISSIAEIPKWRNRVDINLPTATVSKPSESVRRESKTDVTPATSKSEIRETNVTEATPLQLASKPEGSKIGKKHPVKFLKRAQSFSQVFSNFKKPPSADKKKRQLDIIRDDYCLAVSREPLGELALVPLEKLVSIEDISLQKRSMTIDEEP